MAPLARSVGTTPRKRSFNVVQLRPCVGKGKRGTLSSRKTGGSRMRRAFTAITSIALASTIAVALVLASAPSQAAAVTGYDSSYNSESAFVNIAPGETRNFQVFFLNTGTTAWSRGTSTQVDLAACLGDKVTCNAQDGSEAAWNAGWLSANRYATHSQSAVAPGSVATFAYNVRAPDNAVAGTYRFNGDLVLAVTGERIHPDGYYQEATILATGAVGGQPGAPGGQGPQGPPGPRGGEGPRGQPFQPCSTAVGSTATDYTLGEGDVTGTGIAAAPAECVVTNVSAAWVNPPTGSSGTLVCTADDAAFNQATEAFDCTGPVPARIGTIVILTVGHYSNGTESVEPDAVPRFNFPRE
jgi:hypothetical protein